MTKTDTQLRAEINALRDELRSRKEAKSRTVNVLFKYTSPNVGSWNGKWSGEGRRYEKVVKMDRVKATALKSYYRYDFGDGWSAGIVVSQIDGKAAAESRRKTVGFCGYDWMISDILTKGEIVGSRGK